MRSKQTGVTLIGWIILLIPVAICFYVGIRLTPIYLNYMRVAKTLEQVKSEFKSDDPGGVESIRKALGRHLEVEMVEYPDLKDIKITREGKGYSVSVSYDDQAPLFYNLFILAAFDKSVTFGGGAIE